MLSKLLGVLIALHYSFYVYLCVCVHAVLRIDLRLSTIEPQPEPFNLIYDRVLLSHSGWTGISILLPQPPRLLELQACAAIPWVITVSGSQ